MATARTNSCPGKSARSCSSPPGCAHFVSLRPPPLRGQHQRPGKAGSAVFHEWAAALDQTHGVN
ncbi:hypothetical protein EJO66_19730 [Variovorax beijingensis]|uniref:Uncharacterized protein n=1 Tax=Variovorax beijingensis TaxID=2496117 RepID=A0ABY0A349_9BURK|nr:hypothetical protein EJO66_19730 [Variovorax beijingensis]